MAIVYPSMVYPPVIPYTQRVRNNLEVDWRTPRAVARSQNFAMCYARKAVFLHAENLTSLQQVGAGTNEQWRWRFHSGYESAARDDLQLIAEIGILPGHAAYGGGIGPRIRMGVDSGGGATYSAWREYWTDSTTPSFDDIQWTSVSMDISANTTYEGFLETDDYCRLAYAAVYEIHPFSLDTTDSNQTDPTLYRDGADITDAQHSTLTDNAHDMWKHMGCHYFSLVPDLPATQNFSTSSTSYVNILGASTTVSADSRGFTLPSQYRNPVHTSNVVCVLAAYGSQTGADGGDLRLEDATGTLGTISSFTTSDAWHTTTVNLDGSSATHKVDVHIKADSTRTLNIYSVCLYAYVT